MAGLSAAVGGKVEVHPSCAAKLETCVWNCAPPRIICAEVPVCCERNFTPSTPRSRPTSEASIPLVCVALPLDPPTAGPTKYDRTVVSAWQSMFASCVQTDVKLMGTVGGGNGPVVLRLGRPLPVLPVVTTRA